MEMDSWKSTHYFPATFHLSRTTNDNSSVHYGRDVHQSCFSVSYGYMRPHLKCYALYCNPKHSSFSGNVVILDYEVPDFLLFLLQNSSNSQNHNRINFLLAKRPVVCYYVFAITSPIACDLHSI